MESPEFPYTLCPHAPITSPIVDILHHVVCFLQLMNDNIITQRSEFTFGFILSVEHSIGFGNCIHHCSIIQNSFTTPISCVFHLFISPPLVNLWKPLTFILLPFSECHIVVIIQYIFPGNH